MSKGLRWVVSAGSFFFALALPVAGRSEVDHALWDRLLSRHVAAGRVDYAGFQKDRALLEKYLAELAEAPLENAGRDEKLAFWINAYNACVVKGVLDHAPLKSVREAKGFFDGIRYKVAGRELTLNEMENEARKLGDFRVHFVLVCASSSCPSLPQEAFRPDRLNEQLSEQSRQFLSDPGRGLRVEGEILWASQIFKWYRGDFVKGRAGLFSKPLQAEELASVLASYLTPVFLQEARSRKLFIKYMDYDWSLNARTP